MKYMFHSLWTSIGFGDDFLLYKIWILCDDAPPVTSFIGAEAEGLVTYANNDGAVYQSLQQA